MSAVEQYWSAVARRLQEEVHVFNHLITHAGEQGRENELSLTRLLEKLLPRRLGVGSGILIDSHNRYSHQTDIIVYDVADQPSIMAQTTQVLFPVEVVHLVIEVKTTLRDSDIQDCATKKADMMRLQPVTGSKLPNFCVLAFQAVSQPPTVAKTLRGLPPGERPDILCVVSPGILAGQAELLTGAAEDDRTGYLAALVALHSQDRDGRRILGDWQRPLDGEGRIVIRDQFTYPTTRVGKRPTDRVIGEPGRALLLFCSALLELLALRRIIPLSPFEHYLQDSARDVIILDQ